MEILGGIEEMIEQLNRDDRRQKQRQQEKEEQNDDEITGEERSTRLFI